MDLFRFEIKKNWRRKKFLILALLVLVCVIGVFCRNVWMQDEIRKNASLTITAPHVENVNTLQKELREKHKENPKSELLQSQYDNVLEMNALLSDLQNAIKNELWERIPKLESRFLQTVVTHLDFGGNFDSFQDDELEQRIEKNAVLLKHQLPYKDENYSLTATNFIKIAATILISFIGILILVFILGDQLCEDFEHHTIQTLYTQPVRKSGILLSKYASMMVGALYVLLIFIVTCLVIPLIFGKNFGSFIYPQLIIFNDGFTYITITEYLGDLFILFIGTASFTFSLTLLSSILFKNRFSTLLMTLLVLSIGGVLTSQSETLQTPLNPFYYFRFTELIERPDTLGHFSYMFVLFAYSLILLYICCAVQKKEATSRLDSPNIRPFDKGQTLKSSSHLFAFFLFEWRKLWRQGHLKQIIVILLLLNAGGYIFISSQTSQVEKAVIQATEDFIKDKQNIIPWYEDRIQMQQELVEELKSKESPLSPEEEAQLDAAPRNLSAIQENLEHEQFQAEQSRKMLTAYREGDWNTYYDYWIYQNRLEKGEIKLKNTEVIIDKSFFTYNASIAEKEILKARNLRPVLPSEFIYTIYEQFSHQFEQIKWKKDTQKKDNTGLFYLYTFFDWTIYIVPLFILVFHLGAGFTAEKGKKRTLFFLETQPISKAKIFIGKTAISIMVTLGTALGLIVIIILFGTIGNRFGDWAFPVLHYDTPDLVDSINYTGITGSEGGFHFITMGKYLLETSLLFMTTLLFLIVLSLFVSIFIENMINSFVITGLLAFGGYFSVTTSTVSSFSPFLPFIYLNVGKIANGEIATVLNNSLIQPWLGIGVLFVSSIVLLITGLTCFQKLGRKRSTQTNKSSD